MTISVVGDGLAGLMLAHRLHKGGSEVTLYGDGNTNTPPVGLVHLFAGRSFVRSPFELDCFEEAVRHWRSEPLALELPVRRKVAEGSRLQKSLQQAQLPKEWTPQPVGDEWVQYRPGFSVAAQQLESHLRTELGSRYRPGQVDWKELPGVRVLALGYRASSEWARDWDLSRGRTVEASGGSVDSLWIGGGVHRAPFPGRASVVLGGRSNFNGNCPEDELPIADALTGEEHRELSTWSGLRCAPRDHRPLLGWLDDSTFVFVGFGSRALFWLPQCVKLAEAALRDGSFTLPVELDLHRV